MDRLGLWQPCRGQSRAQIVEVGVGRAGFKCLYVAAGTGHETFLAVGEPATTYREPAIPTPHRLVDWLTVSGLAVASCTTAQLDRARELRESIHVAATAAALQEALPASAVQVINDFSLFFYLPASNGASN